MKCPRDGGDLTEVKIEESVLDRCPACGGVWFDFAVMERVLSHDSRSIAPLLPEDEPPRMPEEEYLPCPRCDDMLIRSRLDVEGVECYGCLTCYGRWLDGEKLEQVTTRSLLTRFEALFARLLR